MGLFSRPDTSVLVVCTANICRSPMAEGVLRAELAQRGLQRKVRVASAGTHASQPGRAPDPRAQQVCQQYGIDIGKIRSRQIRQKDFESFSYILAMGLSNEEWLVNACPEPHRHKISPIGAWGGNVDVPDPYYGNRDGFVQVFALLQTLVVAFVTEQLNR